MTIRILAIALSLLYFSGCTQGTINDKRTQSGYRGGLNRTGVCSMKTIYDMDVPKWRFEAAEYFSSTQHPLVYKNRIFIFSGKKVYALDKATGNLLWKKPIYCNHQAAISNSLLIIPAGGKLVALKQKDGDLAWLLNLNKFVYTQPLLIGNKVFFGANKTLYCINLRNGSVIWNKTFKKVISRASYSNGKLYLLLSNAIICFAVDDQKVLWGYDSNTLAPYAPAINGKYVFLVENKINVNSDNPKYGSMLILDKESGKEIWRYSTGQRGISTWPVVKNNKVVFGTVGRIPQKIGLYSDIRQIDVENKKQTWQRTVSPLAGSPVLAGDSIFTKVMGGICTLDFNTGQSRTAFRPERIGYYFPNKIDYSWLIPYILDDQIAFAWKNYFYVYSGSIPQRSPEEAISKLFDATSNGNITKFRQSVHPLSPIKFNNRINLNIYFDDKELNSELAILSKNINKRNIKLVKIELSKDNRNTKIMSITFSAGRKDKKWSWRIKMMVERINGGWLALVPITRLTSIWQ